MVEMNKIGQVRQKDDLYTQVVLVDVLGEKAAMLAEWVPSAQAHGRAIVLGDNPDKIDSLAEMLRAVAQKLRES